VKLVKNAHLENQDGVFKIVHYDTVIFEYNAVSKRAWALMDCSMTSNRQIKFAERFFKPTIVKRDNNPDKWGYSGEITQ